MKKLIAFMSILFGTIAALLVFTPFFKTPPTPIGIFALLGIIAGIIGQKEAKSPATIGIVISTISLLYLVYLFIQLGG